MHGSRCFSLAAATSLCIAAAGPPLHAETHALESWREHFAGAAGGWVGPNEVVVDAEGSVHVITMAGANLSEDFATLKYAADGRLLWVAMHNGRRNGRDLPSGLAIDRAGNVHVAGTSGEVGTSRGDFATLKYASDGRLLWAVHYSGPSPGEAAAKALAVDDAGGVWVAGHSGRGFAVVKYDAGGSLLWEARGGESPENDCCLDASTPVYLALDGAGGAVVAVIRPYPSRAVTVRYDAGGRELWTAPFDGIPAGAVVGGDGSVFVTGAGGHPEGGGDYLSVKYGPGGRPLWTAVYDGPGEVDEDGDGSEDAPAALAVDAEGSLLVTGRSKNADRMPEYATVKYDAAGAELWVRREAEGEVATDLAVDAEGNVYVTGTGGHYPRRDFTTLRYDAAGEVVWRARLGDAGVGGHAGFPGVPSLVLDGAGGVLIAGLVVPEVETTIFAAELLTVRYDERQGAAFRRGDASQDGKHNLGDVLFLLNFLFLGGLAPACADAADANDDGRVNITDPVKLLAFLFQNGAPPPRPGPVACGLDPGSDELRCDAYAGCP